jgi:hypothetical protein
MFGHKLNEAAAHPRMGQQVFDLILVFKSQLLIGFAPGTISRIQTR